MTDKRDVGSAPYSEIPAKRGPKAIFARLQEKCRLRSVLQAMQSDLDAAVQALSPVELQELQGLIAAEVEGVDSDVDALRAQVDHEAILARTQKQMSVKVSRRASIILAMEVEARIARGNFPSAESLVAEAVEKAFT